MGNEELLHNAEFRKALRAHLQKNLADIEDWEGTLEHISPTAAPSEKVHYYRKLGDAYRNLQNLPASPTGDVVTGTTTSPTLHVIVDPRAVQTNAVIVTGTTTALTQDVVHLQSALEIATAFYERALEVVIHEYPLVVIEEPERQLEEFERQELEQTLKNTIQQSKAARGEIVEQMIAISDLIDSVKLPDKSFWTHPYIFRSILVGLIVVVVFGLISFYLRIPISLALHVPPYNCVPGSITVNGSTAVLPLVSVAATEYQNLCTGSKITVNPGKLDGTDLPDGSANALDQLLNNSINIATSDTFADTTISELQDNQVAVVVYALVVNSDVTSIEKPDLSSYQLAEIYSGAVSKWSKVNPTWSSKNITLVGRPASSETRAIFEKYILESPETVLARPGLTDDTSATVANDVCNNSGAIGYVPLYYYNYYNTHYHCLHLVTIDHNDPQSADLVKNNSYKFWSLEHMYTRGPAKGLVQTFINFMYSDTVQSYINQYNKYGYLNTTDIASNLLASH